MPRRTHKKSRNGCIECKRRHVKCDEKRPICSNCISSERHCEYAGLEIISSRLPRASRSRSRASASASALTVESAPALPETSNKTSLDSSPMDMLHVELLHHFTTETSQIMSTGEAQLAPVDILKYGLSAPYLMNQFLALSALHLSLLRPAQQKHYLHMASQLQAHALSIYNATRPEINQETCVTTLIFSSMIGLHTLCDSLNYREPNFTSFLDQFTHCLRLHKGVRTVARSSWKTLRESDLEPFLAAGEQLPDLGTSLNPEFTSLLERIRAAKLGDTPTTTYQEAIQALQSVSTATILDPSKHLSRNHLVSWPALIPSEYIDALALGRPEAVVILAHYAALLHHQRSSWVFGDSGRFIIQSINAYLGPSWAEWLAWPNQVLIDAPPTPESSMMEH